MPYYEFECSECNRVFSVTVGLTVFDGRELKCPMCGSRRIELLVDSQRRPSKSQELVGVSIGTE